MKYDAFYYVSYIWQRRPPHRGAWIEMPKATEFCEAVKVAPRTGGRGLKYPSAYCSCNVRVAPRTGGRGLKFEAQHCINAVARRPPAQGGVD